MGKQRFRKGLAGGLAALMLLQAMPMAASARSFWDIFSPQEEQEETAQVEMYESRETPVQLQNGTAVIPSTATNSEVKEILCEALISNYKDVDTSELEWEYYCTGKNGLLTNDAWGSVNGFTSEKKVVFVPTTFTHPALADNSDGTYQVRLAGLGNEQEVTLTKVAKLSSSITLKDNCTVALPYNADGTVNYDELREAIWDEVVADTTPDDLTVDDVTIEYYATATSGAVGDVGKEWVDLDGETIDAIGFIPITYPAISEGEQRIRISWDGNNSYSGFQKETTVTITERPTAPYTPKDIPDSVTLTVNENLETDFDALRTDIFNAVVASSDILTAENVTITYYAEAVTGSVGDLGWSWVSLEGGTVNALKYPAISAGEQKIRISWPGDQTYAPTTIEATITVNDREQIQFNLNEGPYEVGMKFTADQGYDYAATAQAIYEAVVASTSPIQLTAEDVTVEYNASLTPNITDEFKPLDGSDWTGLKKFGTGEWEIRISWPGNQEYRGNSVTVDVTTTDNRIASAVALKTGVSFTYNMDPAVMEQAIFDNVIDWDNSTLPKKETLSPDNFTIEYKAKLIDAESGVDLGLEDLEGLIGNIPGLGDLLNSDVLTQWVPIEGKVYEVLGQTIGAFPQLGAGEDQAIRVTYKGGADYRPSETTEGTVTVNKASVKVKVHSDNIYADEALPEGFITTDPADDFDQYVIYAGITSNVTTALYLDLPDRYDDNAFLQILDPVVEAITGKSFTDMLNDGVTVGELRELLSTQELLDLLDKLNIDTGTFGQILEAVNKMPGILDSVRISFGAPSRAGLYTVAVVTDNQNYETGFGMGFLLVKMRLSGVHLTWNQELGSKISAADAQNFDFGATLSYDGDTTISQESVSYLYSGFTSKWRVYSSTTTPPTEPGRYVMTVVTLGGNYQAAPITRSFQITK